MVFMILRDEALRVTRGHPDIRVELDGGSGPEILLEVSISLAGVRDDAYLGEFL